jgi:biopolymer transport protein ExbB/TolQ
VTLETQRKAGLWLGLVLLLGAAVGAVFGYSFGHRSYSATRVAASAPSEPERRAKRVADMTRELELSAEQSAKMDEIIHGAHDEMKAIHQKSDADLDAVKEKAREHMREYLTAEQKPKFEAMIQMDEEKKKQAAGK